MRYWFGMFIALTLVYIVATLAAQDEKAQAVCELQHSRDVCWQIFNR